ncbi:MAG: glycine cleavage system aminomethyltransferase GcvT [Nocardioidaceae bacterium]|nr:glycine cleavage system aminomethyltransferase GcvT [Nocardioidaceae bacterium]
MGPESARHSPLHDRHVALGAKMAVFGGWEMPLEYPGGGVLKEHTAVREAVGVFDVSHLGTLRVRGPAAAAHVDACLTNALDRIGSGQAQYTLACDDATGGVVDDLIAYRISDSDLVLVPNAANTHELAGRLRADAPDGVEVVDQQQAILAVQGPRSDELLAAAELPAGHPYLSFASATLSASSDDVPLVVCRTGYTGERGYEVMTPADTAERVWEALLRAGAPLGVRPCGLGARDTLRTEMGYPLHGQDIGPDVTPVQARLGWAVGWDKPRFWGRDVLSAERAEGPSRVRRGLVAAGRGIPRPHMTVSRGGHAVGAVTSGTFSPTLRSGVGLALLAPDVRDGDEVHVEVRGREEAFVVTKPPFVATDVRG